MQLAIKCGKAVQRNRIKRLLREAYKETEYSLKKGYSIVFLIKKETDIRQIVYKHIKNDMLNIFNRAEIIE